MTTADVLVKQTLEAHLWTNKLIDSIPLARWYDTPEVLSSNICWQVGHLSISEYYHSIMVVKGFDEEITAKIDLRSYNKRFGYGSVPMNQRDENDASTLREQLKFVQAKVITTIQTLTAEDLDAKVEQPIKQKHPIAITKFDAVSWNIKHTMWHCGQIATILRLIKGGFDFGLSKPTVNKEQ